MRKIAVGWTILCAPGLIGCNTDVGPLLLMPTAQFRTLPSTLNYPYDAKKLTASDGSTIGVWSIAAKGTARGTVVIMPSADDNKGRYSLFLPIFVDKGWNVVLYDYSGFGDSTGTADLDGVLASSRAVLDDTFAKEQVVVGYGFSMGSSVLGRLAVDYPFAACIFESMGDLWQIGGDAVGFANLPAPLGTVANFVIQSNTSDDWDMTKWITQIPSPKLFLHSTNDSFTPWESTWEIFKMANDPKNMIAMPGEHAQDIFEDPGMYRSLINGWLEGALKLDPIQTPGYQQLLTDERNATLAEFGLTPPN
ncbi:MAG TPA: alpha/beta hydrolase [Phycisphaerae bacterium]|nr:alpha/beta hydrolase [Phycisphaerae bacterium]